MGAPYHLLKRSYYCRYGPGVVESHEVGSISLSFASCWLEASFIEACVQDHLWKKDHFKVHKILRLPRKVYNGELPKKQSRKKQGNTNCILGNMVSEIQRTSLSCSTVVFNHPKHQALWSCWP